MIASALFKKQLELLAFDHPTRTMTACVNQGQVKFPCHACEDICPEGVYTGGMGENADFSGCINCGLCVSACPSRCIAPSALHASKLLRVLNLAEEQVILSEQEEGEAHLRVASLAALPWEYLALLAMKKQVVLLLGQERPEEAALLRENLARLMVFFGKESWKERFVLAASAKKIPPPPMDRRGLFKMAGQELKGRAAPMTVGEDGVDGRLLRTLLHREMAGTPEKYGFPGPAIGEDCTGCGVCHVLCPQKAIRVRKTERGFDLILAPLGCNACGLCEKICIQGAISGFSVVGLQDLTPVRIFSR